MTERSPDDLEGSDTGVEVAGDATPGPEHPGGRSGVDGAGVSPTGRRVYRWDRTDGSVAAGVVAALAAALDRDPARMPPVYDAVDLEMVDRLFAPQAGRSDARDVSVSFEYGGLDVTVRANGEVELGPAGADIAPEG